MTVHILCNTSGAMCLLGVLQCRHSGKEPHLSSDTEIELSVQRVAALAFNSQDESSKLQSTTGTSKET